MEVLVDQLPGLHRLRAGRLPARARQRGLHLRGKEPQHERDEQPPDEHDPEMGSGVAAEPTDRPDVHRVRVLLPEPALAEPFLNDAHQVSTPFAFTGKLPPFS